MVKFALGLSVRGRASLAKQFSPRFSGVRTTHSHAKTPSYNGVISWLGIRDGNITFEDSLDFDISEIESVYEDAEENQ